MHAITLEQYKRVNENLPAVHRVKNMRERGVARDSGHNDSPSWQNAERARELGSFVGTTSLFIYIS